MHDEDARFVKYALIRASVFEPAKPFIIFILNNWAKLTLEDEDQDRLEISLSRIHLHLKNMELHSDEHDPALISGLVKWEIRTMVEMENEEVFEEFFQNMLNRTYEWNRDKRERQKRREVMLREEGWDDAFELRVVGIEEDTAEGVNDIAVRFRSFMAFNSDEE
ncbi:hypothetical protein BLNAU_6186 [Blattamonas nauphoetae]|uniref:Uncharacterized protein n=1 Tax=Blattamonas nauphoetae TaxID=2049346 RepID=A0ABQ9Y5B2_9EUKA|nr:hypothetical protein BLNAU_6186 [Blattamonas nauphoetae]